MDTSWASLVESGTGGTVTLNNDILAVVIDANPYDWYSRQAAAASGAAGRGAGGRSASGVRGEGSEEPSSGRPHSGPVVTFSEAIKGAVQLISAATLGWPQKSLLILSVDNNDSVVLFNGHPDSGFDFTTKGQPLAYNPTAIVKATVSQMERAVSASSGLPDDSLLSYALSKVLCIINSKRTGLESTSKGRILLIDVAPTASYATQYPSLMNAAFAAQRQGIQIDVCSVGQGSPPAVVQQLSEITGGAHLCFTEVLPSRTAADQIARVVGKHNVFTHFLMFHFLPSAAVSSRSAMPFGCSSATTDSDSAVLTGVAGLSTAAALGGGKAPSPDGTWPLIAAASGSVSYSVICCCHHQTIDVALVCSSCLAVYCHAGAPDVCAVCNIRFKKDSNEVVASPFPAVGDAAAAGRANRGA